MKLNCNGFPSCRKQILYAEIFHQLSSTPAKISFQTCWNVWNICKTKKKVIKIKKIKKINNSVFCWTQVIQKYESFEMFSTSSSLLCSNSPQSMEGRGHWAQVRSAWRTFSGYISHINLANWRGWVVYLWTHKEPSFRVQLRIRSKRPTGCSLFAQWSQGKIYRTLNCQHFPGNSMLQSRFVSPNGLLLHL